MLLCNNLYQIFAPQRSGHHAIIVWLIGMMKNKTYWFDHFLWRNNQFNDIKIIQNGNFPIKSKQFFIPEDNCDQVLVSCENFEIGWYHNFKFYFANYTTKTNILVIRELHNCIASRLKRGIKVDNNFLQEYEKYFDEALGLSNIIDNKIVVLFDNWFIDIEYRRDLASNLNLEWGDDKNKDFLIRSSSFDNTKFENNASSMDLLSRFRNYSISVNESLEQKNKKLFNK